MQSLTYDKRIQRARSSGVSTWDQLLSGGGHQPAALEDAKPPTDERGAASLMNPPAVRRQSLFIPGTIVLKDTVRSKLSRFTIELVLIVSSILIAFALDSWWNSKLQREALERELTGIRDELAINIPQLEDRIQKHAGISRSADAVFNLLSAGSGRPEVADSLLISLLSAPTIDPSLGALESFISAGSLAKVVDIELRSELARLPGLVDDALEDERVGVLFAWGELAQVIEGSMTPTDYKFLRSRMGQFWQGFRDTQEVSLQNGDRLANVVARRGSLATLSNREVRQLVSHMEDLFSSLDQILAD